MLWFLGQYLPSCDEDGYYRSHQCHSSSNQCWCVDRYGNEIASSRTHGPTNCGRQEQEYLRGQTEDTLVWWRGAGRLLLLTYMKVWSISLHPGGILESSGDNGSGDSLFTDEDDEDSFVLGDQTALDDEDDEDENDDDFNDEYLF